mgnify:CR=1 FL=1
MRKLLIPLLAALALPTAVNAEVIPKIAFGKKKSYSKVLYKGVISKAENNYKTYAEVVKKFDAFENKTTCSLNIPSGISLMNDTGKYQTYLLSLNNYSDGNGFSNGGITRSVP